MSRDTSTDSTGTEESTDGSDDDRGFELSRRNYVKGVGMAGAATVGGASTGTAAAAIPDSDVVSVGSGGYTTTMPSDADIDADYANPPSASEIYTTSNASGPVPSNDWWSTIALGTQGDPHGQGSVVGLPYYADTNVRGLTVQYPSDWFGDPAEKAFLKMDYLNTPQLTIGHTGNPNFADSRADDWGDWHVRTKWGDGTSATMDVTMLKGSPFFYAEYAGGDAKITLETKDSTAGSPTLADSGNVSVWADRGNVLGVTVDGITGDNYSKHYALFAPSGSTWSGTGGATLTSSLDGQGYLTVALLPDASTSTLDLFEQYAYNFVRDTTVNWDYVSSSSDVETTYQFTTENKAESASGANETLACLFPHQWKHTNAALTGLSYFSPRGELRVHEGSSFTTTMPYRGVLPFMPDEGSYDAVTLSGYVDDLEAAPFWQNGTGSSSDTYYSGKDLNRTMQGVPIAQQVGDTAARDSFLDALKTRLASWFSVNDSFDGTAEEEEVFYYHDTVGSLIGYPPGFYSSQILNDHHFHYGYMINAAAEVARMDDQWVDEYGDMVELVIREYANWEHPSGTDPHGTLPVDSPGDAFPFMRNFDPYSGHSWAGGNGAAADCNNQESSSEAVNAYAGIIKWAELTGNTAMRDAAIYAYTHEVHAVWDYWFNPSHDSAPSTWGDNVDDNSIGGPDFNYASIVWGTGYDHHVFWGTQDQIEIFGINWLPINGHSLYLGWDEGYAAGNWDDLIRTRGNDTGFLSGWKTAAWGYRALHDPSDAVGLAEAELPLDDTNGSGSSSAFTYHWVHNLNSMGTVDTSVVADVPMHAVFDDGGSKTYVAYNPDSSTRTVTFSDGYSMDVPANAQKTSNGSVTEGLAGGSDGGGGGGLAAPTNLSSPGQTDTSVDLTWDHSGDGVAYYNVYVDGSFDSTSSTTSATVTGLSPETTYQFTVTADDGSGTQSPESGTITVTTDSSGSSAWSSTDVGAVDVAGSTSGTSTSVTVEGAGADIWGSADEFHYAYEQVSGDVTVTANVTGVENTHDWAKAGVMVRESLNADSMHGSSLVTAASGTAFQRRTTTGGSSAHTGGSSTSGSNWVRVERSGDTITAYESSDGSSWTQIGSDTIAMSDSVYVGLAVTSHATGTLCTSSFESVSVDAGSAGDTTAPATPGGLTSTGTTDSSVDLSWDAASDTGGSGLDHYDVYVDGAVDHSVSAGTTSTTVSGLSSDTSYDFQVSAVDGAGNESGLSAVLTVSTNASSSGQSAYNGPHTVPGTVQAEDFDTGGEGVAYHDTNAANDGGASYRSTAVDIEGATEGGYNICWVDTGEWWEYTVDVDSDGTYDLTARVASNNSGNSFHVEVDGTDVSGTVSFAATGDWQAWTTVDVASVDLTAGEHVVRVYSEANDWNLNWIEFVQTSSGGGGGTSYSGTSGDGWSATVTNTGTDQYEWSFSPSNAAGWADVQFTDPGTDAWVGYRMDDADGDNVHLHTRDTSSDGSSIDFRFVYDDGSGGQYTSARQNHTF